MDPRGAGSIPATPTIQKGNTLNEITIYAIVGLNLYDLNGSNKTVNIIQWAYSERDADAYLEKNKHTNLAKIPYKMTGYNVADILNRGLKL